MFISKMGSMFKITIAFICIFAFLLVFRYLNADIFLYTQPSSQQTVSDHRITHFYMDAPKESVVRLDILNSYFREGFIRYKNLSCSYVNYPGYGSQSGYKVSGIEGFARTGVLLASQVSLKLNKQSLSDNDLAIVNCLKSGILNGTDKQSVDYWGGVEDYDQRVVESADIARILWLTKSKIWDSFTNEQKQQVSTYLLQVNKVKLPQNNWLLFPVVVNTILMKLGISISDEPMRNYYTFKKFYLSDGWFFDAPHGVDYYNTWGITYDLFWITYVDNNFDKAFIRKAINESAQLTEHLISPAGVPMMGRSVCYRIAIPSPLLANSLLSDDNNSKAKAKRGLFLVLDHFVSNGVLREGTITQGFYENDKRFLDIYSGPGSCHWSLRSMVLANLHSADSPFWENESQRLPIELSDFVINKPKLGWIIEGEKLTQRITIKLPKNSTTSNLKVKEYSVKHKLKDFISLRAHRPDNDEIKYGMSSYNTDNSYLKLP